MPKPLRSANAVHSAIFALASEIRDGRKFWFTELTELTGLLEELKAAALEEGLTELAAESERVPPVEG